MFRVQYIQRTWSFSKIRYLPKTPTSLLRRPNAASSRTFHGGARSRSSQKTPSIGVALIALACLLSAPLVTNYTLPSTVHQDDGETGSNRPLISFEEVRKHSSRQSCWIIVRNQVYDITEFIPGHPGGVRPILAHAGKDVTALFESIHPKGVLQSMLSPSQHLGEVDPSTMPIEAQTSNEDDERVAAARANLPSIATIINIRDIEAVAEYVLSKQAWSYYRSDAEDGFSYQNNLHAFRHFIFRPRVLREVENIDMTTTILGIPSSLPLFVSPAAMAGLGHPLGEINITRGAAKTGIIQAVSYNSSCPVEEIAEARGDGQALIFQLYLRKDKAVSKSVLEKVEKLGFRAVMLTVDAPVLGRRELDMRTKELFEDEEEANENDAPSQRGGVAAALNGESEVNLGWQDVEWLTRTTKLPIIIKGVQSVEDCLTAVQYPGVKGILLSNHGGRQADYAPSSIDVLYELRLKHPEVFDKVEIYVDGGYRRGTDILKAICLGAKACGMGRPFLYANGAYGEKGVVKTVRIVSDELRNAMRQVGIRSLSEATPDMVRYFDRSLPPFGQK